MRNNTVAHQSAIPSEQEFHHAFVEKLRRARRKYKTDGEFAKALGLKSVNGLRKIYNGGSTSPKRMFDALSIDEAILDDICALYGRKLVPDDDSNDDRASTPVVAALHKIIEAEADGDVIDAEILAMEDEIAAAEKVLAGLRNRARRIRELRHKVAELVA